MPYKDPSDKVANNRIKKYAKKLEFFRSMGLEPLDINDNQSSLCCLYCNKITHRSCKHRSRHEEWCPMIPHVAQILGLPISKFKPKQRVYLDRPTEAEIQQRQNNATRLANRRRGIRVVDYEPGAPLT